MTTYELANIALTLIALALSLIALIRTRKTNAQQKALASQANQVSLLTSLLNEYKNRTELFETALNDGTVERENLSRDGMEEALAEYQEKQYETLQKLEKELKNLQDANDRK